MTEPIHSDFPRRHAIAGQSYLVEIAPAEGPRGIESCMHAVVFTREGDGAVFTARIPAVGDPKWLTGPDLDYLLRRAR